MWHDDDVGTILECMSGRDHYSQPRHGGIGHRREHHTQAVQPHQPFEFDAVIVPPPQHNRRLPGISSHFDSSGTQSADGTVQLVAEEIVVVRCRQAGNGIRPERADPRSDALEKYAVRTWFGVE